MAHELMHVLDYKFGITTLNPLNAVTEYDFNELKKRAGKDGVVEYLKSKYPRAFIGNSVKPQYAGISDIISALTENDVNLEYFHSKKYWRLKKKKEREIFADLGMMYYTNNTDVLFMLQYEFPKLTGEFELLMGRIK